MCLTLAGPHPPAQHTPAPASWRDLCAWPCCPLGLDRGLSSWWHLPLQSWVHPWITLFLRFCPLPCICHPQATLTARRGHRDQPWAYPSHHPCLWTSASEDGRWGRGGERRCFSEPGSRLSVPAGCWQQDRHAGEVERERDSPPLCLHPELSRPGSRLGLTASMSAALEETRRACCLLDRQMDDMRQTVSEGQVGVPKKPRPELCTSECSREAVWEGERAGALGSPAQVCKTREGTGVAVRPCTEHLEWTLRAQRCCISSSKRSPYPT
ncbi:hypothetical protein MUG91_G111n33 [Manis pentadactyla]|nr:hypothetical protein MUG91_G111n33 [Manis pentadactyla]